MDRRDQSERTNSGSDRLKKALNVIIQSYRGVSPERLFQEAITCFDGLIEISHGTDTIREFAHQQGLDLKYLVDGANFVISKMHFNPDGNFYLTLGLSQNATSEEIRQRWKKLMLLYHPDRQNGGEEWVAERAKKVNEAYSTLKDDTRRATYDRTLSERNYAKNLQKDESVVHATKVHHEHRRSRATGTRKSPAFGRIGRFLPKILIAFYILAALVVLSMIYLQNRSASLETELTPQPGTDRQARPSSEQPQPDRLLPAVPRGQSQERGGQPSPSPAPPGPSTERSFWKSLTKVLPGKRPAPESDPKEQGSAVPESRNADRTPGREAALPVAATPPAASEARQPEQTSPAPSAPPKPVTVPAPVAETRAAPEARENAASRPAPALQITREEIEEFMQRYVTAYSQNDLATFLSLFSASAVENNTLHYQEIRNAYRDTFASRINHYKLQNMTTKLEGGTAFVSANYQVNQYISREDRWIRHSGRISWKIVRENSALKIVSLNYDK